MIFVIDAFGNLIDRSEENIYQGSNEANKIQVIAPLPKNVQFVARFTLPFGNSQEFLLKNILSIDDKTNLWELPLDIIVTQYHGKVEVQLKAFNSSQTIATTRASFYVQKGIPVTLPETPSPDIYEQILQKISEIEETVIKINDNSNTKVDKTAFVLDGSTLDITIDGGNQ